MPRIRSIAITLLCLGSVATPMTAGAQSTAAAPRAAAVPTSNANVWNGLDHQPTEASAPRLSAKREKKVDHTLGTLDQQLLDQKLPKVPAGAP